MNAYQFIAFLAAIYILSAVSTYFYTTKIRNLSDLEGKYAATTLGLLFTNIFGWIYFYTWLIKQL